MDMFPITKKARHTLFRVAKKAHHLLFPPVKGYTSVHAETVVSLLLKER